MKFISSWENFGKKTWSGTPFGIYQALCSKIEVELCDVSIKRKKGFIQNVKNAIENLNANITSLNLGAEKIDLLDWNSDKIPGIVFSEYNSKNAKNLYCYQDLYIVLKKV